LVRWCLDGRIILKKKVDRRNITRTRGDRERERKKRDLKVERE
jgi:hypothetical protein